MTETYEIETLNDFLKVPEDRIDQCLKEFKIVLATFRMLRSLADDLGHQEIAIRFPSFTWTDDGELNMKCRLVVDNQPPAPSATGDEE